MNPVNSDSDNFGGSACAAITRPPASDKHHRNRSPLASDKYFQASGLLRTEAKRISLSLLEPSKCSWQEHPTAIESLKSVSDIHNAN